MEMGYLFIPLVINLKGFFLFKIKRKMKLRKSFIHVMDDDELEEEKEQILIFLRNNE